MKWNAPFVLSLSACSYYSRKVSKLSYYENIKPLSSKPKITLVLLHQMLKPSANANTKASLCTNYCESSSHSK